VCNEARAVVSAVDSMPAGTLSHADTVLPCPRLK